MRDRIYCVSAISQCYSIAIGPAFRIRFAAGFHYGCSISEWSVCWASAAVLMGLLLARWKEMAGLYC